MALVSLTLCVGNCNPRKDVQQILHISHQGIIAIGYTTGYKHQVRICLVFNLSAQFTQMIWKKTKTFGIAYAEYEPSDANGFVKTVIVANYYPCGNLEGKFKDNVIEADVTSVLGDRDSKLQKKLNQYQRKKKRQANQARLLGRGSKDEGPGNLGFGTI